MKANNGKGNNSSRDEWETPSWIFDPLMKQYGFEFDCCATKENKKTRHFSNDFLNHNGRFVNVAWMNPPFSKASTMFKHFFKIVGKGVAIYRCDNFETKIWQEIIFSNADWIFIPDKRVSYKGLDGDGARFPSALIGIGVKPPKKINGCLLKVEGLK